MNSSCALLAEFHLNLLLDQLSVSANLQMVLIGYRNIGKIPIGASLVTTQTDGVNGNGNCIVVEYVQLWLPAVKQKWDVENK